MTDPIYGRRLSSPVRFTLASNLGSGLDGAWWPRTASIARELSDLADALRESLGQVIDHRANASGHETATWHQRADRDSFPFVLRK